LIVVALGASVAVIAVVAVGVAWLDMAVVALGATITRVDVAVGMV